VAGDVIEAARNVISNSGLRTPILGEPGRIDRPLELSPLDEVSTRHYIRLTALDRPGVLSRVSGVLAEHDISIESVSQVGRGQQAVPIVMLTHQAREAGVRAALDKLANLDVLTQPPRRLRIEEEV